ncbi:BQ5605_C016g08226 [Microbotryum silenes-dioicae]|uniref:BQ5605_C016g08226 protein n=1 Tax=Microbotryum silenes-dioicae TaxID=796604 RepID=A0A2X0NT90_9BASI|nr:BQ5605_C016g08226 [Microbotryum silenes-dioicae]
MSTSTRWQFIRRLGMLLCVMHFLLTVVSAASSASELASTPDSTSVVELFLRSVKRHEHHDDDYGPYEQNFMNEEPLDSMMRWHIGIQTVCWGFLFPLGMVLGLTKSKFHAPLQVLTSIVSLFGGNFLAHHHGGREFHTTAHSKLAHYLKYYLILQFLFGTFLKTHVWQKSKFRRGVVVFHSVVGKSFPVVGWVQMIFGGIATLGFCFGEHTLQCVAHFAMGSGFIGYGIILLVLFRLGARWLERRGCAQEMIDSWVLLVLGIVNTFTEHNFLGGNGGWSHKDMNHVSLGVLWWAGGALGVWLSRGGRRNIVPGLLISMTGYAMSGHAQAIEFSTAVHKFFGFALMAAGFARVIEVCFLLSDQPTPVLSPSVSARAFQHMTPYLLVLSGLTFLSSTEEQMAWVGRDIEMDHITYANILFATAFVIYLVAVILVETYERLMLELEARETGITERVDEEEGAGAREDRRWIMGGMIPLPKASERFWESSATRAGAGSNDRQERTRAPYESVPMSISNRRSDEDEVELRSGGSSATMTNMGEDRSVFDIGEEEEADAREFWDEAVLKEQVERATR